MYTTDGDLRYRDMCYALLELKWEMGTLGAEPLFQAGWYYTASMREALSNLLSNLPCFIIYIVGKHFKTCYCETKFYKFTDLGAHIGFAGAVWTDRPHLQVLSPVLPLFYHATDVNMRMRAARYFGAAKKAIGALRHYYEHELAALNTFGSSTYAGTTFPHPNKYISSVRFY